MDVGQGGYCIRDHLLGQLAGPLLSGLPGVHHWISIPDQIPQGFYETVLDTQLRFKIKHFGHAQCRRLSNVRVFVF